MKRIRKSRAARFLSWLLTVVIITLTPRMSAAQAGQGVKATGGRAQTAIVVDFEDKSGRGNRRLSADALNAVAVELSNSQQFEILSTKSVADKASELGLRAPYDQVAVSRIAADLGATVVISGELAFVQVDSKKSPKTARVGLRIFVREASTGDVLNGAAQVGESRARAGIQDDDSLIAEALSNASVQSVKQIVTFNLPQGTVMQTITGTNTGITTALVNVGSRDGIHSGMEMVVTRGGQRVGRLRITTVFATDSEARVFENTAGIRPEDKVRAIFPVPPLDPKLAGGTSSEGPRKTGTNGTATLGKILVVLVVGIAIYFAISGGKKSTVTGVIAEPTLQSGAPAVRVTWRDNIFGANTLEYHIWRLPDNPANEISGIPNLTASLGLRQAFDFPSPFSLWDAVRSFQRPPQPNTNTGGGNNNGGNLSTTVTPAAGSSPGFVIGRTVTYGLTSVIRRQAVTTGNNNQGGGGGGGGNAGFEDVPSDLVVSGPATPIIQPVLGASPPDAATNVDIQRFNPTWLSAAGADVFVVELSLDRTFTNRNGILQLPLVFSTAGNANGVTQSLTAPIDLSTNPVLRSNVTFLNFVNRVPGATKPTLFLRVGGKNSGDSPGPVHVLSQNPSDSDKTFRYIYSTVRSFQPAELPPPPP